MLTVNVWCNLVYSECIQESPTTCRAGSRRKPPRRGLFARRFGETYCTEIWLRSCLRVHRGAKSRNPNQFVHGI